MNRAPKSPVFLERASYRQRRLRDAARLLPVLGAILWMIPLLWSRDQPAASTNADALLYTFGVWVALIVLSAVLSRGLRPDDATPLDTPD
ncbi:hypothetical protein [Yoonia sp.]|uniref:hypothetical protein n=1 Tax=Yoonia sp. TaxID=2212373 RepID=UPI0025F72AAB|nr:hypothetical protein [Yoonia sp.]